MQAFLDSTKKKPEPNPVSMNHLIRTIKQNQNQDEDEDEDEDEDKAWKVAIQRKIDKCMENQKQLQEEKNRDAYQKKMQDDLKQPQEEQNNIVRKISSNQEDESMAESQDSYSTHGIMRILTNPNKDKDDDEVLQELLEEEEMYKAFAEEIEQDLA